MLFGASYSSEPTQLSAWIIAGEVTPLNITRTMTKDEMIGSVALMHSTLNALIAFKGVEKIGMPANGIGLLAGAAVNSAFSTYWINKTYGKP